ncbi:nucleoside recognition domain-containing protein [Patescibacteria group bacterium]
MQKFTMVNKIDKILLNKVVGIPIFFLIIWVMFQAVFSIGQIPMDLIDFAIFSLQNWLTAKLPDTIGSSLLIDGVIGGVGAMIVFLPLIILLFFFISVFRQTGYLSRISILFEKVFNKIGLSGKSIVPLSMGFGCNVPAIMALNTLETKREKLITAMMIPFLSCSATLPIYTLLIAAFFEVEWRGTVLFALYVGGIFLSFITGMIFHKVLKKGELKKSSDLPKYKIPKLKSILSAIWITAKSFLFKAGKIILPFSIIMWFLFTFPLTEGNPAQIEESYAAQIGMAVEPIFEPIGFDWRINTALFGALGAKEVFISTLGIFYSLDVGTDEGLIQAMQNDPNITPLTAVLILIFILVYSPCVPVIATMKEQFSSRWAFIAFIYPTVLAWVICFIIYQTVIRIMF